MAMSDPIADMLTRIRNAGKAKHIEVDIPGSKLKIEIAKILKIEGYIKNYKFFEEDSNQGRLRIYLKNYNISGHGGIVNIDRVSKPSRRVYRKARDIKTVYNGMGTAILSTSYGLMTDKDAREKKSWWRSVVYSMVVVFFNFLF